MAIQLTERAARHVLGYAGADSGQPPKIRLSVRPSGCSGFAYDVVLVSREEETGGDFVFQSRGVEIVVDPKSFVHVDGTVLDYVREGLQEGFRFENPNAKSICGCGESFQT